MRILREQNRLKDYLEKFHIPEKFQTEGLRFRLFYFGKGEYLASPYKDLTDMLFLVEGTVKIYDLRADASLSPVAPLGPLSLFGDVEFATKKPTAFFVEAQTEVLCVALSLVQYEAVLRRDSIFLNELLCSIGEKIRLMSAIEIINKNVEERVLFYLKNVCKDNCMPSIHKAITQLHCSRRQLQRVLSKLCKEGRVERVKKGSYRLVSKAYEEN